MQISSLMIAPLWNASSQASPLHKLRPYNLIVCCLAFLCLALGPAIASAHSPDSTSTKVAAKELAQKILAAYGGEQKFKQVYEQGWHGFGKYTQISLLSGAANNFEVEIFDKGNKIRQQMNVLGEEMVGGFDGKHSWLKEKLVKAKLADIEFVRTS